MKSRLIWDESKRQTNLSKHGLDFADAVEVLESRYRLDIAVVRGGESRIQSFAYVFKRLKALTVVHVERESATRVISFRYASEAESEVYYEWVSQDND